MNYALKRHSDFTEINLEKIFFIDIETVATAVDFSTLDARTQGLWEKKAAALARQAKYTEKSSVDASYIYRHEAGIHSEFAKIICISIGYLRNQKPESTYKFIATSFYGTAEHETISNFHRILQAHPDYYLCAHNGFDFDFSFICRRSIIQQLSLPPQLKILQKKPWNTPWLLDTMDLWKFMGQKNFTSLDTLAHILQFPSPKKTALRNSGDSTSQTVESPVDGSMIHDLYYHKQDFPAIYTYCEHDCLAAAQIILRLREKPIVRHEDFFSKPAENILTELKHKDPTDPNTEAAISS